MPAELIHRAAEILRSGGLVAFPTETVYGLGADATNPAAVAKIFAAKGRPSTNPLIVHIADVTTAKRFAAYWPASAQLLADRFWPGPLTLVLPRAQDIPDIVTAGRSTVGLRMPNHPLALELLRTFGGPVAAPSANRSNRISPTTADHVRQQLPEGIDLILDGGPASVGIESTVLSLAPLDEWPEAGLPILLRPGAIVRAQIEAAIGPILTLDEFPKRSSGADASPGLQPLHYAPLAEAFCFRHLQTARVADWLRANPDRATLLLVLENSQAAVALTAIAQLQHEIVALARDPAIYARGLYAALHAADARNFKTVFIESPPDAPAWVAVHDRLRRATQEIR